jgi:hypothetical protein
VAHTIISFEFYDRNSKTSEFLALSVEARKEVGEKYSPFKGLFNKYEIIYVWATENDIVKTRVEDRNELTYRYELDQADQVKLQKLFKRLVDRTNKLASNPEFYHTIWNNCTIDLWQQVNLAAPDSLPFTLSTIFPEKSGEFLIKNGLVSNEESEKSYQLRLVPEVPSIYENHYPLIIRGRYDPYEFGLDQPYQFD